MAKTYLRMNIFLSLLIFLNVLGVQVSATPLTPRNTTQWTFQDIPSSTSLLWYPCYDIFFCAMLDVPLTYDHPTSLLSTIPLLKYPATTTPYLGLVLSNPGGPGESSLGFLSSSYEFLQPVIGTNYDIVSWDPRGVGYSVPYFNCGDMPTSRGGNATSNSTIKLSAPITTETGASSTNNVAVGGLKRRELPKIYGPNVSESVYEEYYSDYNAIGSDCLLSDDLASTHLSTTTVAHDMLSIIDAFVLTPTAKSQTQDPTLVNYYGFSYGTYLGQVFASLFPTRIGRFVLDGVVDPDEWTSGSHLKEILNTDDVFATFFIYCAAAGSECEFYTEGDTALDLYDRFEAPFKYNSSEAWAFSDTVSREVIFGSLYQPPTAFPYLSSILTNWPGGANSTTNGTANVTVTRRDGWLGNWKRDTSHTILPPENEYLLAAISCGDNDGALFNRSLESFQPGILEREKESWVGGGLISMNYVLACAGYGVESVDKVFTGPFGRETKNPILFVSNTLDPITPHVNGEKATHLFPGAQLLTIEGTGHTSFGPNNTCAFNKINHYFQTGQLPGYDNFCALEAGPWGIQLPAGELQKREDWLKIRERLGALGKK